MTSRALHRTLAFLCAWLGSAALVEAQEAKLVAPPKQAWANVLASSRADARPRWPSPRQGRVRRPAVPC